MCFNYYYQLVEALHVAGPRAPRFVGTTTLRPNEDVPFPLMLQYASTRKEVNRELSYLTAFVASGSMGLPWLLALFVVVISHVSVIQQSLMASHQAEMAWHSFGAQEPSCSRWGQAGPTLLQLRRCSFANVYHTGWQIDSSKLPSGASLLD
jgi:hypothetical protein